MVEWSLPPPPPPTAGRNDCAAAVAAAADGVLGSLTVAGVGGSVCFDQSGGSR